MNWVGQQFSKFQRRIRWPAGWALVALFLLSVGSSPRKTEPAEISAELRPIVEGNSRFALKLFPKLANQNANLILSPFSISSAMAMAYGGAEGNTEKQIAQVFHFPTNLLSLHAGMGAILTSLTNASGQGVELQVANGMWLQKDYQFTEEFTNLCRRNYRAFVDLVDFNTGHESARQRINSWIKSHTKGRIGDLFAPGVVSHTTRLVLANAVYFKGSWASRFEKRNTRPKNFWTSSEKSVLVPMMSQKSTFSYLSEEDVQVLELPYRGDSMAMLVLLPKARDGLAVLVQQLTFEKLSHLIEKMYPASVELLLPKFKTSSAFGLSITLSRMGMPDAFNERLANFTGMTPQRPVFLDQVAHAALVEVDEEGTVAAAGTGASFSCSQQPSPATFHADHPFVFIILDKPTHTVLFIGKLTEPAV